MESGGFGIQGIHTMATIRRVGRQIEMVLVHDPREDVQRRQESFGIYILRPQCRKSLSS